MDVYMRSPLGPMVWFCSLVFTRSRGNTHVTPTMPAMPPFRIFGNNLVENNELLEG